MAQCMSKKIFSVIMSATVACFVICAAVPGKALGEKMQEFWPMGVPYSHEFYDSWSLSFLAMSFPPIIAAEARNSTFHSALCLEGGLPRISLPSHL